MKKVTIDEASSEIPEDFDPMKQEFHLSVKATPISEDETATDIHCKLHCTAAFAKNTLHTLLKDDEILFSLLKEVIVDIMIDNIKDGESTMVMGKGGDA